MRIPNVLVYIALALFVVTAALLPWTEIGWRVGIACAVLFVGFILFALRLFGGGDIKMLSALMLFIPSQTLSLYGVIFSASMLLGIAFILTLRRAPFAENSSWVSLGATGKFPMGISIALSGLLHPFAVNALF